MANTEDTADGGQAVRATFQRVPFQNADSDRAVATNWVVAPSAAQLLAPVQSTAAKSPMWPPTVVMLTWCQPLPFHESAYTPLCEALFW